MSDFKPSVKMATPKPTPTAPTLTPADKAKLTAAMERALAILRPGEKVALRWVNIAQTGGSDDRL